MTRKPLMAGNWKMNNTVAEAVVLTQEISNRYEKEWAEAVDVLVCPPFVDLKPAKTVLDFDKTKVAVGAQNVHWEPKGAFTGEVSVAMIKEIGCACSIVGHSERRELFGDETADAMRVLYGGSMNVGNVEGLMAQPNIDGGLVGGASLEAASFVQLIEACL